MPAATILSSDKKERLLVLQAMRLRKNCGVSAKNSSVRIDRNQTPLAL